MSKLKFYKEVKINMGFFELFGASCAEFRSQTRVNLAAGYSLGESAFMLLPDPLKRIYIKELYRLGEQPYCYDEDEFSISFMREAVRLCPALVKQDIEGLMKQWYDDGNGEYELFNDTWKEILSPLNLKYLHETAN